MPPYSSPSQYVDDPNNRPLRPFSTFIGGHEIPAKLDRRATQGSKDITSELRQIGLTDRQIFETFAVCENDGADEAEPKHCELTEQQVELLIKKELGGWWVDETALWEYEFPANKMIEVLHEYQPHAGSRYYYAYDYYYNEGKESLGGEVVTNIVKNADCDGNENEAIQKRVKSEVDKGADQVRVFVTEVSYILRTGNNWKGPISNFKLRVKKDDPDQVVSVCFPGKPRRISNTVFEFSEKDFVPQDDLLVNFYNINGEFRPSNDALNKWVPSGYAKLTDLNALPSKNIFAKEAYIKFLAQPSPRAFLICKNNDSVQEAHGNSTFVADVIQKRDSGCEPYVVNASVVWIGK
jgi:hypothetical protein